MLMEPMQLSKCVVPLVAQFETDLFYFFQNEYIIQ